MEFYQEITLIPNAEIEKHFLLSKVYQQLHLGLVEMQDEQNKVPIGISFPEYQSGEKLGVLGAKLRLFAPDEATLARLNVNHWLCRLSDYVHYTGIRPVPDKVNRYAVYRREQPKTSRERLARRYAKRHGLDYETALTIFSKMPDKTVTTPFIRLKSLSSGNLFCLWIKKTEAEKAVNNRFTTYGLSFESAVPEF